MSFSDAQARIVTDLAALIQRGRISDAIVMVDKLSVEQRLVYQSIIPPYQKQLMAKFGISSLPLYDPVLSYMLLMEMTLRNYHLQSTGKPIKSLSSSTGMFESFVPDVLSEYDKEYTRTDEYRIVPDRQPLKYGMCLVFTVPCHAVIAAAAKITDKHIIPSLNVFEQLYAHMVNELNVSIKPNQLITTLLDHIVRNSNEYNNIQSYLKEHLATMSQRYSYSCSRFSLNNNTAPANTIHGVSERSFFVVIPVELEVFSVDAINWFPWLGRISRIIMKNQMRGVAATLCYYEGKNSDITIPQDAWLQWISTSLNYEGDPIKATIQNMDQYVESVHCHNVRNGIRMVNKYPVWHYNGVSVITLDTANLKVAPSADAELFFIEVDTIDSSSSSSSTATVNSKKTALALFSPGLICDGKITVMVCYNPDQYDSQTIIRQTINSLCQPDTAELVEFFDEGDDDDYAYRRRLLLNNDSGYLEWVPRGEIPPGYSEYQTLLNVATRRTEYLPLGPIPPGYQAINK